MLQVHPTAVVCTPEWLHVLYATFRPEMHKCQASQFSGVGSQFVCNCAYYLAYGMWDLDSETGRYLLQTFCTFEC